MTIASEIEDLQTNLAAAKAAVTAKGGTVGNTGLAGLATEIASIPSGGGPSVPQTLYGSALVYPFASKTYALDPDDPMIEMCTINSIDQAKLAEFAEQYPPESMGDEVRLSFRYSEDYDNPGNYVWSYMYEDPDTGFGDLKIPEADMLSTTGIDVTVDSGETWASFELSESLNVNSDAYVWLDILDANEYNNLGIRTYVDPVSGETVYGDTNTYTIGGYTFNKDQIKGFAFGTANTTTPNDNNGFGMFKGCNNLVELHFDYATSMTSIGSYFLYGCKNFDQAITLPSGVTSIGGSFLYNATNFNKTITLPTGLTSIGDYFLVSCSSFNQALTLPNTVTSIGKWFMQYCSNFNSPLTLSTGLTSIGQGFMPSCTSFNQPLTLPNGLTTIGSGFLNNTAYNYPLTMPSTLTSIGSNLLYNSQNFTSTITCEAPASTIVGTDLTGFLSCPVSSAPAYTVGITLKGTYRSEWMTKLPNLTGSRYYRKLIDGGA